MTARSDIAVRFDNFVKYYCKIKEGAVVPRVVPQHSNFNNLDCQTTLMAITGAKGILPRCQTRTVTTPKRIAAYVHRVGRKVANSISIYGKRGAYEPRRTAEVENARSADSWMLLSTNMPMIAMATAAMHAKTKALMIPPLFLVA
jgi:hypothetical protein